MISVLPQNEMLQFSVGGTNYWGFFLGFGGCRGWQGTRGQRWEGRRINRGKTPGKYRQDLGITPLSNGILDIYVSVIQMLWRHTRQMSAFQVLTWIPFIIVWYLDHELITDQSIASDIQRSIFQAMTGDLNNGMTDVDSTVMTDGDSTVLTVENGILFVCKIKLICAFAYM